jgi:hypothetical protein
MLQERPVKIFEVAFYHFSHAFQPFAAQFEQLQLKDDPCAAQRPARVQIGRCGTNRRARLRDAMMAVTEAAGGAGSRAY